MIFSGRSPRPWTWICTMLAVHALSSSLSAQASGESWDRTLGVNSPGVPSAGSLDLQSCGGRLPAQVVLVADPSIAGQRVGITWTRARTPSGEPGDTVTMAVEMPPTGDPLAVEPIDLWCLEGQPVGVLVQRVNFRRNVAMMTLLSGAAEGPTAYDWLDILRVYSASNEKLIPVSVARSGRRWTLVPDPDGG